MKLLLPFSTQVLMSNFLMVADKYLRMIYEKKGKVKIAERFELDINILLSYYSIYKSINYFLNQKNTLKLENLTGVLILFTDSDLIALYQYCKKHNAEISVELGKTEPLKIYRSQALLNKAYAVGAQLNHSVEKLINVTNLFIKQNSIGYKSFEDEWNANSKEKIIKLASLNSHELNILKKLDFGYTNVNTLISESASENLPQIRYYFPKELLSNQFTSSFIKTNTIQYFLQNSLELLDDDFIKIYQEHQKIFKNYDDSIQSVTLRKQSFISTFNKDLEEKISAFLCGDNAKNHLLVLSRNSFLINKIISFTEYRLDLIGTRLNNFAPISDKCIKNNLYVVENFDSYSIDDQRLLAHRISRDKENKYLISCEHSPIVLNSSEKITNICSLNDDATNQNISRIFFSIITEVSIIKVNKNIEHLIETNAFRSLLNFSKLKIEVLYKSCQDQFSKRPFDVCSVLDWYNLRNTYLTKINKNNQEQYVLPRTKDITIEFILNKKKKKQVKIKALTGEEITCEFSIGFIHLANIIEYHNYNSNHDRIKPEIKTIHLSSITDSNEYNRPTTVIKLKERISYYKETKEFEKSNKDEDYASKINKTLKDIHFNNEFQNFIKRIEVKKDTSYFNDQSSSGDTIYNCKIKGLDFDYNLFDKDYLPYLKKILEKK